MFVLHMMNIENKSTETGLKFKEFIDIIILTPTEYIYQMRFFLVSLTPKEINTIRLYNVDIAIYKNFTSIRGVLKVEFKS